MTGLEVRTPGGNPADADRTTDTLDSARADARRKRIATLLAKLALEGWTATELPGGAILIARWGRARHCIDLQDAETFARTVGVR